MINIGILNFNSSLKKNIEGSSLSRFLLNIYLTEVDSFINQLSKKFIIQAKKFNFTARQSYKQLINEFNSSRIKYITVKYGSVQKARSIFKNRKKTYYNKWCVNSISNSFLQYVRYADFFLIGVSHCKKMALSIQQQIDTFIKSNLHLKIKQNKVINRNEGFILFLGFRVYITNIYKQSNIERKNYRNLTKYKSQIQAHLKKTETKLAKTVTSVFKKNLTEAFHIYILKHSIYYNKKSIKNSIDVLINQLVLRNYNSDV